MSEQKRKPSPVRSLIRLLWRQPLWAVPFAIFFGTLFGAKPSAYVLSYKMSLVFTYSIGLGIWVARRFLVPRFCGEDCASPREINWRIGLIMVTTSLVSSYTAAAIIHFTFYPGFLGSVREVVITGMWTLLFAALFTGINYAIAFHREAVERARQVELIRAELAEAELRALRAQVNPHFLFNTLNSIASLIRVDPAAAEEVTAQLADVFRYALRSSGQEHARFGDELEFLRSYLEIERVRFGDRLRIEEEIEPGLESIPVPSLLLQPLVENAVLHGISARPEGGTLRIAAHRDGERLAIEIADDGPGMNGTSARSGNGFGLESVRERLRAVGLADALEIDSTPTRGTHIRIRLPVNAGPRPPLSSPKGASS